MLQGCESDLFPGGQPIPQETIDELLILNASLGSTAPGANLESESIGASVYEGTPDFESAGKLSITIVPNEFAVLNRVYFSIHLAKKLERSLLKPLIDTNR